MSTLQLIQSQSSEDARKQFKRFLEDEHISFSAVSTYLRCPRQFKYKYVQLERPAFIADDLLFGIAFHRVVAGYYGWLKTEREALSPDKLVSDWESVFEQVVAEAKYPVRWKKPKEELAELGKAMLVAFAGAVRPRNIIGAEVPFSVPLHDPRTGEVLPMRLVGSIDLVEADDAGNIVVSELKTAGKKWSELDAEQNIQASLYSYVVAELGLNRGRDVLVRFDVVTKAKNPSVQQLFTTRSEKDHDRVLGLIADVHRAIEARCFHVNPSWACLACQYRPACRAEV